MYCDRCGQEIERNAATARVIRKLDGIVVEVMAGHKTVNGGHVCASCVIQVVRLGEDVEGEIRGPGRSQ
jgi:hypothetical protein